MRAFPIAWQEVLTEGAKCSIELVLKGQRHGGLMRLQYVEVIKKPYKMLCQLRKRTLKGQQARQYVGPAESVIARYCKTAFRRYRKAP